MVTVTGMVTAVDSRATERYGDWLEVYVATGRDTWRCSASARSVSAPQVGETVTMEVRPTQDNRGGIEFRIVKVLGVAGGAAADPKKAAA